MFRHNMLSLSFAFNDRVETVLLISSVVDNSDGAVRLVQGVVALHHVAVAGLVVRFNVLGVGVLHFVLELVFGVALLKKKTTLFIILPFNVQRFKGFVKMIRT